MREDVRYRLLWVADHEQRPGAQGAVLPALRAPARWKAFASLVLEAAYEATMLAAALNAQRGDLNIVLLTLLGGGAFGNKEAWILDAVRRALGRASSPNLDARIVSYGASSRAVLRGKPAIANLHRAAGASALVVHSGLRPPRAHDLDSGVRVEIVTAADIAAEPRLSNALAVWSTRHGQVAVGDQVRVLVHLDEASAAPLIEAARSAIATPDGVAAVLAFACRGLIAVDLETEPIGPETAVRRVRRPF